MPTEVHSIPGTEMFPQLKNAIANRLAVAENSCFQALEADADLGLRLLVPQRVQPFSRRFFTIGSLVSKDFDHKIIKLNVT